MTKKKFLLLVLTMTFICDVVNAQKVEVSSDAERRVNNCALILGMSINNFLNKQPIYDVRSFADTLYHDLYTQPAEIKTSAKYAGKIYLQAFFALSEDKRIDYPDIERCLAVTGKHDAFYTVPFIICASFYARWADEKQLTDKEIAALQLGLKAHDKLYHDSTTIFSYEMNLRLSNIYLQQKKWRSAAKYTERFLADMRRLGEEDTEEFTEFLSALGTCYKYSGKNIKADSCFLVVQKRLETEGKATSEDYIDLLVDRAEIQGNLGNYEVSEKLLDKAKSLLSPNDSVYHWLELQIANHYSEMEKYDQALSLLRQELNYFEKKKHEPAKELLPWIVFCNNPLSTDERQRFVRLLENNQDGSIENMAVLAYAYSHGYQYEEAWKMTHEIEKAYDQLDDERKEELTDYLLPLYISLNDLDHQIGLSKIQVQSVRKVVGDDHDLYASALALEASIYGLKGDYHQCLQLLDSCTHVPNIETSTLISVYDNMSEVYSTMGDYQKSSLYASVLLDNTDDAAMKRKLMGRIVVNMINELEIRRLDIDEKGTNGTDSLQQQLILYAKKLLDYSQQLYGDCHLSKIEAMEYLASAYYLANDTSRMVTVARRCEEAIQKSLKNPAVRKTYLEGLVPYYRASKDYQKALNMVDMECLSRQNAMFAETKATLEALAELNLDIQHHDEAQKYYERLANSIINETAKQMGMLTSKERQYYWRMTRHLLSDAGKYLQHTGEQHPFAGTLYDLALFSKNLLLSSDQAFVRSVKRTGDQALLEKMHMMMNLRTAVIQDKKMNTAERTAKAEYADQLERELLAACGGGDKAGNIKNSFNWVQIQQALADSALAMEMVQFTKQDNKEYYGAAMLKKGWNKPVFVQIGEKSALDSLKAQDLSSKAGNTVWQFAKPYLEGIKTVYFSPIGVFHTIPIEDMPYEGHDVMSNHFQMYRLSSTQQLLDKKVVSGKDAVIYGGLEYGMTIDEMRQDANVDRGAGDYKELQYLKGSEIEADSIMKIFNGKSQNGMKAFLYKGKKGTESSFKALDGKHTRLIHIGTHGFYVDNDNDDTYSILTRNSQNSVNLEDRSLKQSGLYMAGAENVLNNETLPEGVDDGVLTSQEVSILDLNGLDMVCLSACQTAQGRITGDGVFGLQRGFKKAGANSIIMSLWDANDDATCMLMTEFYKNLIVGCKTKYAALEAAKETVRSHKEKGWDDPKYWAAFILLDGLE